MGIGLQRIYQQIDVELTTFENQLNKLDVQNYPSVACEELIRYLLEKVPKYRKVMCNIMEDKAEGGLEEAKRKLITKVHNPLTQQDALFLSWLRNAETGSVPWSFIPSIEDLAHKILPDKQVLVLCENTFNYGVFWSESSNLAPYTYCVFALPKLHRVNVLWHTLIGHELFHPRCVDFINRHNQDVLTKITQYVAGQIEKSVKETVPETLFAESEQKDRIDEISYIIHTAWRRAMEELLCDMACVIIFGPAALLAMRAFSACSPSNSMPNPDDNFYPSWQYRFEVVWKHIVEEGKIKILLQEFGGNEIVIPFEEELKEIGVLVASAKGTELVKKHPQARIAYAEVENLLPCAAEFVKEALPSTICRWTDQKIIEQIPNLAERLSRGIPPNEIVEEISEIAPEKYKTTPADLVSIMIAGWIYECYWLQENKHDGGMMKYKTMCRLLLKACEDIKTTI